jgi:chromosome partitioning protein
MFDDRTNLSRDVAAELRRYLQQVLHPQRNVRLAEAPSQYPILQDIKSRGAEAYLTLARELLRRAA